MSERNKKNKENCKDPHIGGSKSNMNHAKEIEAITKQKPTRSMVYKKTHRRSNGTVLTELARERIRQIDEILNTGVEDVILFQEPSVEPRGDILSQVIGPEKRGRWHVVGPRMKYDKQKGISSSSISKDEEIRKLHEQVETLRSDRDEMQNNINQMKSDRDKMLALMDQMSRDIQQLSRQSTSSSCS